MGKVRCFTAQNYRVLTYMLSSRSSCPEVDTVDWPFYQSNSIQTVNQWFLFSESGHRYPVSGCCFFLFTQDTTRIGSVSPPLELVLMLAF